ncbi:serine/threonine-protein kinase [Glycomyces mayteni]|uniref:non-specific serine/threonine protein kinase n=1 Tax=Glycomyces mayteni TaxID=543887 RepID=A0ABW2DAA9_9ACTN
MQTGSMIADRYRLDAPIASGGMGSVWNARDTRLRRAVAVKVLKSNLEGDATARARFAHEAQAVASLRHPGIAALHDYGETPDGEGGTLAYLVMELIEGPTLTERLRGGPLPHADAMRLTAEVAEALHHAHGHGIVHRDIKPANIIVDPGGHAVLVDFGIALSPGRGTITESGMLMGTLYYASPEQLEGRPLTGATDVYSLGAVAYECLSGTPPFTGDTAGTILNGHLNQPPPPLDAALPPAPAAAILQALAKDPEQRWATAEDFARVCREAVADPLTPQAVSPVLSVPGAAGPWTPPAGAVPFEPVTAATPAPRRRGRRLLLAAPAAVAVLAAAVVLALSPWSRADDNGDGATGVIETRSAAAEDTTQPATGTGSPPADPSASATEPQTAEAATEAAASESEDDGGPEGGGSGTDPTEDEGGQVEPGAASLPDVTGIWYTDARDELASAGWESVVLDTVADDPGNGQTECSVVHQNPSGGTPTHYDTTVTLTYWESFPGAC